MLIYDFNKHKNYLYNTLNNNYIIYGNDVFLKSENMFNIIKLAKKKKFNNILEIIVNNNFKFETISNYIKEDDLFTKKKILILNITSNYLRILLININKLFALLNKNIFLIIKLDKFNYIIYVLFKKNKININLINCNTLTNIQLEKWLEKKTKYLDFNLSKKVIKLLSYYYEGNILELNQILKTIYIISLTEKLNISYIKKLISNQAYFYPSQFSESILCKNFIRTIHILKQLFKNKCTPITLVRFLQNDLLILINLKRFSYKIKKVLSRNDYYIYKTRKIFFNRIEKTLDEKKIYLLLKLLTKIELMIYKENNEKIIWLHLKNLYIYLI